MWKCLLCNREFIKENQVHSCNDKTLEDFLKNKPEHTLELFYHFLEEYKKIGAVSVHATKSMIVFSGNTGFAYIIQISRNFIDIVLPFKRSYDDNLCFTKIKSVPGTNDYNHHFRMCLKEDINEEVKKYMRLAFEHSQK